MLNPYSMVFAERQRWHNRRERSRKECQMAHQNRKYDKTFPAGIPVVVYTLDTASAFGDEVHLWVNAETFPKVTRSKAEGGVRSSMTTRYGTKFSFISPSPEESYSGRLACDGGIELCSAKLSYGCLALEYDENGTTIHVDETDSSYVLPIKTKVEGETSYEFYVVQRYANVTLDDVIEGRWDQIRIPGVKLAVLEKANYYKDWDGHDVLQMNLIVDGKFNRSICVEVVRPEDRLIPAVMRQLVSGEPFSPDLD